MEGHPRSRVWLEINLGTLRENFKRIQEVVSPLQVIAILKANAYGLGVRRIAKTLVEAGVSGFGVAELKEAVQLVELGKPVQILGGALDYEIPEAVKHGIILGITDIDTARRIDAEAARQGKIHECHFKIDTGMGRLGIIYKDAPAVIEESLKLKNLNCCGIYSHFPVAYRGGSDMTNAQIERFYKILDTAWQKGVKFTKIHIANSDAINNFPSTYHFPFTHVRTGINIHGSFDNEGQRNLKLESVLTLKTRLAAVRRLPKGYSIGYGCTCNLVKDTLVGTIAAGYADGLPLALSNRGYVIIKDRLCPVLGRISMDYTTVSLENFAEGEVLPGDDVICLGGKGVDAITVENWSQLKGTHPYDIICSIGSRVERIYVDDVKTQ
jgi:alanine racemase